MTTEQPNVPASQGAREALVERLAEAMQEVGKAHDLTGTSAWDCVCRCGGWPKTGQPDVQHSDHVAQAQVEAVAPLVAAEVEAAVSVVRAERDEARPSDDRRSERWAQAIWGSSWTPQDLGLPEVADCMALADLENVQLRREVIGLREQRDDAQRARDREEDLRLSVAAEVWALREKVAKVEALRDEWAKNAGSPHVEWNIPIAVTYAAALEAALSDPTTPDQTGGDQ